MLAFASAKQIYLASARSKRPRVLAANAKQNEFSDITEIKPDSATVRASIFADFVPNDVGFIVETPGFHDGEAIRQERIWTPQVKMSGVRGYGRKIDLVLALLFQQTARPFLLQGVPPHTFFVSEQVSRSDVSELFLL